MVFTFTYYSVLIKLYLCTIAPKLIRFNSIKSFSSNWTDIAPLHISGDLYQFIHKPCNYLATVYACNLTLSFKWRFNSLITHRLLQLILITMIEAGARTYSLYSPSKTAFSRLVGFMLVQHIQQIGYWKLDFWTSVRNMSFLRGTEEYYQKFIELQEKLRKR